MSSVYLILTVGTGTAGPHSSLVDGLRKTIELIGPSYFWLIPSSSEDSIATADLVREGFESFVPWAETDPYCYITAPDSLQNCRETVRQVIRNARDQMKKGRRLIVNPTSGTKQMSAGATVAALDENIGELVFTIGERADGVVKTGTERLETFEARDYFAERDFILAQELYQTGAFLEAAKVLKHYPQRFASYVDLCECIYHWENLNYSAALKIAGRKTHVQFENLLNHLRPLCRESSANTPHLAADLLKSAERLHGRKDFSNALFRACKAYEIGARAELLACAQLREPYTKEALLNSRLPEKLLRKIEGTRKNSIHLGLADISDLLVECNSDLGAAYRSRALNAAINIRHELAHQIRAVTKKESSSAINAVKSALQYLRLPVAANLPKTLEKIC